MRRILPASIVIRNTSSCRLLSITPARRGDDVSLDEVERIAI
jgi:hypothetical protein